MSLRRAFHELFDTNSLYYEQESYVQIHPFAKFPPPASALATLKRAEALIAAKAFLGHRYCLIPQRREAAQ